MAKCKVRNEEAVGKGMTNDQVPMTEAEAAGKTC